MSISNNAPRFSAATSRNPYAPYPDLTKALAELKKQEGIVSYPKLKPLKKDGYVKPQSTKTKSGDIEYPTLLKQ